MITPEPRRARPCPIAACWWRRRVLGRVEERQERMRRLRVAAQVRTGNLHQPMQYRFNSTTVITRNIEIETGQSSSTRQTMLN